MQRPDATPVLGPDEKTPLLISVESCYPQRTVWHAVHSVPRLAVSWHPTGCGLSVISALVCWATGNASTRNIDVLMFKSIFVIFGLTLGFRLTRANTRASEAQAAVKTLLQAAVSTLVLLPHESKESCAEDLLYLLDAFCSHLRLVSSRTSFWFNIMGLQPTSKTAGEDLLTRASPPLLECTARRVKVEANLGPRTLMVAMMCYFGELICAPASRNIEFMWRETRTRFIAAYDEIEILSIPSVCDNYVLMVNILLAGFGMFLPWGIAVPGFQVHTGLQYVPLLHFRSSLLLLLNTMLVTLTLFGLNGLAQEIEDPFAGDNEDDIDMAQAVRVFREKVLAYQGRLARDRAATYGAAEATSGGGGRPAPPDPARWEAVVQEHREICPLPSENCETPRIAPPRLTPSGAV